MQEVVPHRDINTESFKELLLLEDLKKNLCEKDEALLETTQHVEVLQIKLDEKNLELAELVENLRKLEEENENLDNKLLAEDYATHIKVRDLKERHKADLTNLKEQVRLLNQEAERSEGRSLSIEASFLSKIEQIQEELDNVQEKEELETLQKSTQQERTEQDPSCKNELAELRHGPLLVSPAPREQTIENETYEECEEALEIDPSEQVVVARKGKRRVNFFKRLFTA
ncbi:testis-specific gene 10 protein-like [Amblyraja radiata]|uniref:testis-specific gene 10 protein-like n=1 Tax=Amblyraja radiata TaxID=386614 RepID=UPI001403367C|nr:testis-specific gene 10 protein-like [Amblyraja radiata]